MRFTEFGIRMVSQKLESGSWWWWYKEANFVHMNGSQCMLDLPMQQLPAPHLLLLQLQIIILC